jgi:hypothetical protein
VLEDFSGRSLLNIERQNIALIQSLSDPTPDGTVFESISFIAVIVGFGLLFTLPLVAPIAASAGYRYGRYLASGQN